MSTTPYYVYIVKCSDDTYYTGIAVNVEKRIDVHNTSPLGARYTKMRRPVLLVYTEACGSRSEALKREYAIKQLPRKGKESLILKTR